MGVRFVVPVSFRLYPPPIHFNPPPSHSHPPFTEHITREVIHGESRRLPHCTFHFTSIRFSSVSK